jgi:hypothetical protein
MLTLATAGGSQTVKASVLLPGPLAQWQSGRLLISRFRVRSPGGLPTRRWRNRKAQPLRWSKRTSHQALNLETAGSSPARSTMALSSMGRIAALQAAGQSSSLCRATAEWCKGNMLGS